MTPWSSGSSSGSDVIVGYRTFVAVIAAAYFTLIALTPRDPMMMPDVSWGQLLPLSVLYLPLGIWGFDYARRRRSLPVSLGYLLIEFAVGMRINALAWGGGLPLILLPLAAQAVILLPRILAAAMCILVIAGVSGNLSWMPAWPHWLRNIAQATAAVVFVVVYVGVAQREREARQRTEALAAEVAQLAAANERNRMAREIHDTLGHYLTVIHVQLEAARAVIGRDPERGMLAVTRAQALAKDGLTAVRQSVKALREEGVEATVDGIAEQIASIVESVRDEQFRVTLTTGLMQLRVHDDGRGAVEEAAGTGFGLRGIRERAEQLKGRASYRMAPNEGFTLSVELPA
jgi:signal transduction histidine kinase